METLRNSMDVYLDVVLILLGIGILIYLFIAIKRNKDKNVHFNIALGVLLLINIASFWDTYYNFTNPPNVRTQGNYFLLFMVPFAVIFISTNIILAKKEYQFLRDKPGNTLLGLLLSCLLGLVVFSILEKNYAVRLYQQLSAYIATHYTYNVNIWLSDWFNSAYFNLYTFCIGIILSLLIATSLAINSKKKGN